MKKLVELAVGSSGTIVRVMGEGKVRRRLFDMGVTPNASFFVRKKADRKSTRLNSSHVRTSRMPSSA